VDPLFAFSGSEVPKERRIILDKQHPVRKHAFANPCPSP